MIEAKYFTPSEAQLTLPLVRKIVEDILDASREMHLLAEDFDVEMEDNPRIKKLTGDIENFMYELEELGCYYKDWNFNIGLVDFPAIIDGREVYLCWKSDENKIKYYHGIEEGYSGRKPIPPSYYGD
jgi:hypothetical protein